MNTFTNFSLQLEMFEDRYLECAFLSFLLPAWNMYVMSGSLTTILDHETTLGMEATCYG